MQIRRHRRPFRHYIAWLESDLAVLGEGVAVCEPDGDAGDVAGEELFAELEQTVVVEP